MGVYVLGFDEVDRSMAEVVGGKGAQLAELSRLDDVSVPAGFCVTTDAFRRALAAPTSDAIEAIGVPDDVAVAITRMLDRFGEHEAYAVRSSGTAEDLATASFAGQHDSYLNVVGASAIVAHVGRCWASLFSDGAVAYRIRNGFGDRKVEMAVVVQRMVVPRASGVLFTADPATGNRSVARIEATFGLAEDLVAGLVEADGYAVRDREIVDRVQRQEQPVLTDVEVEELVALGRRVEAHFGHPQDIEWCLDADGFQIVQSRPITTLFPIPQVDDEGNHVFVSVGHGQMMTDPMKPLGLSVWNMTTLRPMYEAGGRLFVDVAAELASPTRRAGLMRTMGTADPLVGDALQTIVDRGDVPTVPDEMPVGAAAAGPPPVEIDPAVVDELVEAGQAAITTLHREIQGKSGPALLDFILDDIAEMQQTILGPRTHQAVMAAMESTWSLNDRLAEWLDEKDAADTLARSAPNNVTSQMGLALLDVADVVRPHPEVVALLEDADDAILDRLPEVAGGQEAHDAIRAYLDRYGMRCVGEIDITRPRWAERPSTLVPLILGNVRNFEAGASERRFTQGRHEAMEKEQELLERLRGLPDGAHKAAEIKRLIDRVRAFIGYREYPKYHIVCRYFAYRQALLREAERLVEAGVLHDVDDISYLTHAELREVVQTNRVDEELVRVRREAFRWHQSLTPPRVMTSDGEIVSGTYRREEVPDGALVGLPVSAGVVEGRARVVLDMANADFDAGDILVTTFTDPSWTPAFVAIRGLVTEVGGLMTHGAVIAREYGLPAVVGVEHATRLIRDGQRIRVDGTNGFVTVV